MKDMSIYQQFCEEVLDEQGNLVDIRLHYPENFNFGYDVVDVLAKEEPDRRAIVWVDTENHERTVTFAQLRSVSNQVAHVLLDAGIGAGSRVIVALKRHVEYWFTAIALHKIGALMIPVTHMLTAEDIAYRLEQSHADACICTPQNGFPDRLREALQSTGLPCRLFMYFGTAGQDCKR